MKEVRLKVRNDLEVEVKYIGVIKLSLESGFEIFLKNTFYVPIFRKNLIFVLSLDKLGFDFNFHNEKFNLMFNSQIVGYGILKMMDYIDYV